MAGFVFGPHMVLPHVDVAISTNDDNWAGAAGDGAVVILVKNSASVSRAIRGIANGQHGRLIFIVLASGPDLTFPPGHALSPAGTRLQTQGGAVQTISENGCIAFWYDGTYLSGQGQWVQVGLVA